MSKWPRAAFLDAVDDVTRLGTKIQARNYHGSGIYPIYDQGQNKIAGYTDEPEGLFSDNLPVVIFGDHTRSIKLADRPFFLGADGVKILRPRIAKLDPRFLFHVLSAAELPNHGYSRHFKFLREITIPLPPLDEQRRIVDLLERAAGIRRLREQALAKARAIVPALFLDMFGDPATNPKGWPVFKVEDLLDIGARNGISPARSGQIEGEVLTLSAITGDRFDACERKPGMFARALVDRDCVSSRDLLICRGNGNADLVGRAQVPTEDMPGVVFPDTMIAVRPSPKRVALPYLAAVWDSSAIRARLRAAARTTNGTFKINQGMVNEMPIPLPPLPLQRSFADRLADLRSIISQQERSLIAARALERSLMARLLG